SLVGLIEEDPERAIAFAVSAADLYRYIIRNRNRTLVPLSEEVRFLDSYYSVLRERFGDGLNLHLPDLTACQKRRMIPPVSLQLLLDNVARHNLIAEDKPLMVSLSVTEDEVVFSNERRPLRSPAPGTQT